MAADAGNEAPARAEVLAALERVTRSALFLRSSQLQRLLRYLVEETLAGRAERLKEFVIGVEVFGRPSSFDPRIDSLVRVEARRLRAALDAYYADEGRPDPVVIRLAKGAYHPAFERAAPAVAAAAQPPGVGPVNPPILHTEAPVPPAAIADVAPTRRAFPLGQMVLGVAVVVGIVVSISAWLGRSRRVEALTDRDSVVLTGFSNSTGEPIFDETLRQGLAVGLEQSPFLNIIPDRRIAQILTLMGRTSGEPVSPESAREACARAGGRAAIAGSVNRLGARYVIGLTATNCATGADFAHVQVEAASREVVLTALSTAVTQMRGKLGESLASIEQLQVWAN